MKGKFTSLLLAALCICSSLVAAQERYITRQNIPYTAPTEPEAYRQARCKLDVYYPKEKKGFKTLVWFHGGALKGGDKSTVEPSLMENDFAVVAPDYRLYPKTKAPGYIEDAAAAVAWVFRHIEEYGGDPSQIYVAGHSAGGYLAMMLALDKRYLSLHGIEADSVKGYFPISGQTITHYTIREERGLPPHLPVVDQYAPVSHLRKLHTELVLITGDRQLEQTSRYEENLYLKSLLEGVDGNREVPIYELSGFDHGNVVGPACRMIADFLAPPRR